MEDAQILTADRNKFDSFLYLSLTDALEELDRRRNNTKLQSYVDEIVGKVPEILIHKKSLVLFRHIATPNHEICRFITATESLKDYQQLIFEYTSDRFLSRNESKHALGKLRFVKGINKKGDQIIETHGIVNFNDIDNKNLLEIKTLWGQGLVDFHHELFFKNYSKLKSNIFDLSNWLKNAGGNSQSYYKKFLALFLKDAILFENFLLETSEKNFTSNVVIPAIREISQECGFTPLIVALEPTNLEGDKFWLSYPESEKNIVAEIKDQWLKKGDIILK